MDKIELYRLRKIHGAEGYDVEAINVPVERKAYLVSTGWRDTELCAKAIAVGNIDKEADVLKGKAWIAKIAD